MPGHRRHCCRCDKPVKGKMANGYVSWYSGEDRTTFYTRWSIDCFADAIAPIIATAKEAASNGGNMCIACGTAIEGEPELVFLTLFPPRMEQIDYEFEVCPTPCFENLRNELARGGILKPDRNIGVGAQGQAPTPTESAWASFAL